MICRHPVDLDMDMGLDFKHEQTDAYNSKSYIYNKYATRTREYRYKDVKEERSIYWGG
jgi:hypothetical protein